MKNNNFIIIGSSGGIGSQLVADLAVNNPTVFEDLVKHLKKK